jgi:hypothetical protein
MSALPRFQAMLNHLERLSADADHLDGMLVENGIGGAVGVGGAPGLGAECEELNRVLRTMRSKLQELIDNLSTND